MSPARSLKSRCGGLGLGTPGDGTVFFDTTAYACSGMAEGPLLLGLELWGLSRRRRRRDG
jgi:hypothetical protein